MTNYRIRVSPSEIGEWKFCFTCGKPLERRPDLDDAGDIVWGCSARMFHLLVFVPRAEFDYEEGPEFL